MGIHSLLLAAAVAAVPLTFVQPPDPTNSESVVAWMGRENLVDEIAGGYRWIMGGRPAPGTESVFMGVTSEGVLLAERRVSGRTGGIRGAHVRMERYEPKVFDDGYTSLSQSIEWEINCARNAVRPKVITEFAGRKRSGVSRDIPVSEQGYTPFSESIFANEGRAICTVDLF